MSQVVRSAKTRLTGLMTNIGWIVEKNFERDGGNAHVTTLLHCLFSLRVYMTPFLEPEEALSTLAPAPDIDFRGQANNELCAVSLLDSSLEHRVQ